MARGGDAPARLLLIRHASEATVHESLFTVCEYSKYKTTKLDGSRSMQNINFRGGIFCEAEGFWCCGSLSTSKGHRQTIRAENRVTTSGKAGSIPYKKENYA